MKIREIETRKPFLFCVMVLRRCFFFLWENEVFLFRVEENNKNSLFLTRKLVQFFFVDGSCYRLQFYSFFCVCWEEN